MKKTIIPQEDLVRELLRLNGITLNEVLGGFGINDVKKIEEFGAELDFSFLKAPHMISSFSELHGLKNEEFKIFVFSSEPYLSILPLEESNTSKSNLLINTDKSKIEDIIAILNNLYGFNLIFKKPNIKIKKSELEQWCLDNGYIYIAGMKASLSNIAKMELGELTPISPEALGIEIVEG